MFTLFPLYLTYKTARQKGIDPMPWMMAALVSSWLAVIVLLVYADKKDQ
jgi:hypothetical protein